MSLHPLVIDLKNGGYLGLILETWSPNPGMHLPKAHLLLVYGRKKLGDLGKPSKGWSRNIEAALMNLKI